MTLIDVIIQYQNVKFFVFNIQAGNYARSNTMYI